MSTISKLMADVLILPLNSLNQTSISAPTVVSLHTVAPGKSYTLTSLEVFSDAPSSAPVLVQIQVAGVVVYGAYVNSLTPLHWTNSNLSIQAAGGNLVQLVLGKTTAVQNMVINAGQYEY